MPNLTAAAAGRLRPRHRGRLPRLAPSLVQVAAEFPDTSSAGVDRLYGGEGSRTPARASCRTRSAFQFTEQEAGYLVGISRRCSSRRQVGHRSSARSVANKMPSIDELHRRLPPGRTRRRTRGQGPRTTLSTRPSSTRRSARRSRSTRSPGADVVFQVAGRCGLGALDAARRRSLGHRRRRRPVYLGGSADERASSASSRPCSPSSKSFTNGKSRRGTTSSSASPNNARCGARLQITDDVPTKAQDAVDRLSRSSQSGKIKPPATVE